VLSHWQPPGSQHSCQVGWPPGGLLGAAHVGDLSEQSPCTEGFTAVVAALPRTAGPAGVGTDGGQAETHLDPETGGSSLSKASYTGGQC
jgi:hypothetical protein